MPLTPIFEPGTPTAHGRAESAQPLKQNPKQKIQFEAIAQNTRRCMLCLLAGPMMFCGPWPPPCGVHHAARQYFPHLPPHVLAGCPICISCFVQALYLFFRYRVYQIPGATDADHSGPRPGRYKEIAVDHRMRKTPNLFQVPYANVADHSGSRPGRYNVIAVDHCDLCFVYPGSRPDRYK